MIGPQGSSDTRHELERILQTGGVRTVYQPIVDLHTRRPVGYEALARGPAGSILESAPALFNAARAENRLFELDR
jgi:EAL domain-containing protein (putative c-di-GMP-specific phosphodiesterase class I)